MSQYGKAEYWDDRYTKDTEPFDWFQRFSAIKDIVANYVKPDHKILNVGSGNSRLTEEMVEEGYQSITNIDISSVVIKDMNERYKDKGPYFKYQIMDVRDMSAFGSGTFDCVIDKATLDSILCGESSTSNAQKMLSEIHRVLSKNGVYIIVSYGQPEHRLLYLEKPEFEWQITTQTIPKPTISTSITIAAEDKDAPNFHYLYICRKGTAGAVAGKK